MRCCAGDEGFWPFGAALRGEASNHRMLRWLKTVVVSDAEKAHMIASGGDREDERSESLLTCRYLTSGGIKTGESCAGPG